MKQKTKLIYIVLALSLTAQLGFGQACPPPKVDFANSEELIQKILDLPKLQWMYQPEVKNRLPIKILATKGINKNQSLSKFEQKVRILTASELKEKDIKDYIVFDTLEIIGDTTNFKLHYAIEGVGCSGKLVREKGEWSVVDYTVWEN